MKKRVVILGAGESGIGAAILAKAKGFPVFVSDAGEIKEKYKKILIEKQIEFEANKHTDKQILSADEIIKSPGIPEKAEIIKKIRDKNINIISEIEFASRYTKATKICITGSNGKTTTTNLIYYILKSAGINVGMAGNVGDSFARQVAENGFDVYVIEISSFQLDDIQEFRPEIAIMMNITPDHLDRYEYEFQKYIDSKFKITQNQTKNDYFIYCADDRVVTTELKKRDIKAQMIPFSMNKMVEKGAYLDGNMIIINIKEGFNMQKDELALLGIHNTYNSMASGIASKLKEIRNDNIRQCLSNFKGVPHRLEEYLSIHGIIFINDSKATNVNSTWYALESMKQPTVWIVGGVDKGNDYSVLQEGVRQKVKAIVCLGKDNEKIHQAFEGMVEIFDASTMEEAVRSAYYLATNGDAVLLSPACASFDLFDSFEDRGMKFKEAVSNL